MRLPRLWLALTLTGGACGDGGGGSIVPDARVDGRGTPDGRPDVLPARDGPRPDGRLADGRIADAPIPFDAGPDDGGVFLSDTAMDQLFAISAAGDVVFTWDSPVTGPTGIAIDRRLMDGLWVVGTGDPNTFYKMDFAGMVVDTVDNFWSVSGTTARGLDYFAAAGAAEDVLVNIHVNSSAIDVLSGTFVATGEGAFQSGFADGSGFLSGYWGVHMVDWVEPMPIRRWVSRQTTDTLERWNVATLEDSISVTIPEMRGVTVTPSGEFYVVDASRDMVFRLDAAGAIIGSFATPGPEPAGISYVAF